jgi:hypothetical protein
VSSAEWGLRDEFRGEMRPKSGVRVSGVRTANQGLHQMLRGVRGSGSGVKGL